MAAGKALWPTGAGTGASCLRTGPLAGDDMSVIHLRGAKAVAAYPAGSPSAIEAALKEREVAVAAVDRRDSNLMHGFQPTGCRTVWRIQLPPGLTAASLLRSRSGLGDPPAATVTVLSQHCAPPEQVKPG